MSAELVSVIVRSMDRASLAAALQSIAEQSHPAIEVVIVNAKGSAHAPLPQRCGAFPVVVAGDDEGRPLARSAAANCGLRHAGGTLLLFLDDDDLLLPGHISRLVAALQAHPAAPAAYAGVEMGRVDDAGGWLPLHRFDDAFDGARLLFENYLPIHAVLFRRQPALEFDARLDLFEDWDWWLQLAALGPLVHVGGISARYCITGSAQSEVFADTPQAAAARAYLFEKWRHRIDARQYGELLRRTQTLYRRAAQQEAALDLAQAAQAQLHTELHAREHDLAEAARMRADHLDVITERERERDALRSAYAHDRQQAAAHAAALTAVTAEREREIGALKTLVAARERELADTALHAANLEQVVADRDIEITNLHDAQTALNHTLAATQQALAATQQALAAHSAALEQLRAETLSQAARRILWNKNHDRHRD